MCAFSVHLTYFVESGLRQIYLRIAGDVKFHAFFIVDRELHSDYKNE